MKRILILLYVILAINFLLIYRNNIPVLPEKKKLSKTTSDQREKK